MFLIIPKISKIIGFALITFALIHISTTNIFAETKKKSKSATTHRHTKKTKKRYRTIHNEEKAKSQAIELIRENSPEISEMVGVQPIMTDSSKLNDQSQQQEGEDLDELAKEDDVPVNFETIKSLWLNYVDGDDNTSNQDNFTSAGIKKSDIMSKIYNLLGTPYHYGGVSDKGIDCSAFVRKIYESTASILLPRTAHEQFTVGKIVKRADLQFGDIIFFHTRKCIFVSHVGIYLGDNLFAHSSSRYGVTISSLESTYYDKRFIGAKRITQKDIAHLTTNKNLDNDQNDSNNLE